MRQQSRILLSSVVALGLAAAVCAWHMSRSPSRPPAGAGQDSPSPREAESPSADPPFSRASASRQTIVSAESGGAAEPVQDPYAEYAEPGKEAPEPVEPPTALRVLLNALPPNPSEAQVARVLEAFRVWGEELGEEAIHYALSQLSGQLRLDSAVAASRGWAERDLPAAAQHVARLLVPQHDYLVYAMADDYGRRDGAAALEWALEWVPAEHRPGAAQHATLEWLRRDPEAALDWIESRAEERPWLNRAERRSVWESVSYLAGRDLAEAWDYVEGLPTGGAFESGADALLDRWIDRDITAAGEWLASLVGSNPDLDLDQAVATYAQRAAETRPDLARLWAERVRDESERRRVLRNVEGIAARRN